MAEQINLFTDCESLRRVDQILRERISAASGSPFVAHYDLSATLEHEARNELVAAIAGLHVRVHEQFSRFPCACIWMIAKSLAKSYGGNQGASIYTHIARCLGTGEYIPLQHRESLNRGFRRACLSQGLALPPAESDANRMVDDYLFQAGVARNQLPSLAAAFLRAERTFGLPEADDTRDVDDWEDRAVEFAPPGLKVLRRVVKDDPTGFHATAFMQLRLRRDGGGFPPSEFVQAFQAAISDPSASTGSGRNSDDGPALEFSHGELRVALPPGATPLEVEIRDRLYRLRGGRNLGLPLPWPSRINWRSHRGTGSSTPWQQYAVFTGDDRIGVFDGDSGRRKCELDLRQPSEGRCPGGLLCLVARAPFEANGEHSHQLGEQAFVLYCDVSTQLEIRMAGLRLDVVVDPRLRLQIDGVRVVRNQNGWLIAKPRAVQVFGDTDAKLEDFEIRVRHSALRETLHLPLCRSLGGAAIAELSLPDSGNCDLARVSLHINGQERALYRYRFWYWPGLERFVDARLFVASSIPSNLAEESVSHIARNHDGNLALAEDDAYLRAQLGFRVNRRIARFDFPPPGVSISVRRSDGTQRPLRTGTTLTVGRDYASTLIVRCADPEAAIDLKGIRVRKAFGKIGHWSVSFSTLAQDGAHDRVRLLSGDRHWSETDLVKVVPETEPDSFTVTRIGTRQIVAASFAKPVCAIQIHAENLFDGERLQHEVALDGFPAETEILPPLRASRPPDDRTKVHIELDGNNYGHGVWFVELMIREDGRHDYMPLANVNGESYGLCVAPESWTDILDSEYASGLTSTEAAAIFARLSRIIGTPVAPVCRQSMKILLVPVWRTLGTSLATSSGKASLLDAWAISPSVHARESWLPRHHPLEVAPDLLALPAEDFARLSSSDAEGYDIFEEVGLAGITESILDAMDLLNVSDAFLAAFQNASDPSFSKDSDPGAFDFSKYRTFQQITDDDKLLSKRCHRRYCERMADRWAVVAMDCTLDGKPHPDALKLGKAMHTVRRAGSNETRALDVPEELVEEFPLLAEVARMISALARASRAGNVDQFWTRAAKAPGQPPEKTRADIGYVLRIAPELLAFYLILWELVERNSNQWRT